MALESEIQKTNTGETFKVRPPSLVFVTSFLGIVVGLIQLFSIVRNLISVRAFDTTPIIFVIVLSLTGLICVGVIFGTILALGGKNIGRYVLLINLTLYYLSKQLTYVGAWWPQGSSETQVTLWALLSLVIPIAAWIYYHTPAVKQFYNQSKAVGT